MIIEFELQGSKCLHKGIFDTTGFWVRYEVEEDLMIINDINTHISDGYKIFSHFSFSFYHTDERIAKQVYGGLIAVLCGLDWHLEEIGFIRKIC